MRKLTLHNMFLILGAVVFLVGCSDRVTVTGKVTYIDGSPLQAGEVAFSDGRLVYRGNIDQNGGYKLGGVHEGDGISPGMYEVYLIGAETMETDENNVMRPVQLVAQKYLSPDTSELTCEVKGKMTFDFKVERP